MSLDPKPVAYIARNPQCRCVVGVTLTSINGHELRAILRRWDKDGYDVQPGTLFDAQRSSMCPGPGWHEPEREAVA